MKTIGIDFGTTNSVVYTYSKGCVEIVPVAGRRSTPSVLFIDPESGKIYVGNDAKKRVTLAPENTILSNKRFIGDLNKTYDIGNYSLTPVDVASEILKYLANEASKTLGEKITDVVITVPAYFNNLQNSNTKLAAEKAGLNVLQLLKEPSAAAIFYGYDQGKEQTLLIYDFGGGTFDISILKVQENKFTEMAIGGDSQLGGDDFDSAVAQQIIETFRLEYENFEPNEIDIKIIEEKAELIKIALTNSLKAEEQILLPGGKYNLDFTMTRDEFNILINDQVDYSVELINKALAKTDLDKDDINRIVLVGGTSKIPLIKEKISLAYKDPYTATDVDEIVAAGASIMAASFIPVPSEPNNDPPPPEPMLVNVTAHNLGVKATKNGDPDHFSVIIAEQSKIKAIGNNKYTTEKDNQSSVPIGVFQGHGNRCNDANVKFIGGFILNGIPPAPKRTVEIDVQFILNKDDILDVVASCSGGATNNIQLNVSQTANYNDVFITEKSDVFFLFDVSGSMSGERINQVRKAAAKYSEIKENTGDRIGCYVFGSRGDEVFEITDNFSEIISKLSEIKVGYKNAGGGTNMRSGLELVLSKLTTTNTSRKIQVIILSDGYNYGKSPRSLVEDFKAKNVVIHTVGAGSSYDKKLLEYISTNTGGVFVPANDISKLVDAFVQLSEF
jgi:molecular chaperone DnaK (HSP70)